MVTGTEQTKVGWSWQLVSLSYFTFSFGSWRVSTVCGGLVFMGLGRLEEPLAVGGRMHIPSFSAEIFLPVDSVKTSDGLSGYDEFILFRENLNST